MRQLAAALICGLAAGCTATSPATTGTPSGDGSNTAFEIDTLRARYAAYTLDEARRIGYEPDRVCLDAAAFGRPPQLGAMGFHATNTSLLRGPLVADRPQALVFDGLGRLLGVEYEILADAVREPPVLFGRTFTKMPTHAGMKDEHYALHLWLVPNPSGQFADFNPSLACPANTAPAGPHPGTTPMGEDEMH